VIENRKIGILSSRVLPSRQYSPVSSSSAASIRLEEAMGGGQSIPVRHGRLTSGFILSAQRDDVLLSELRHCTLRLWRPSPHVTEHWIVGGREGGGIIEGR